MKVLKELKQYYRIREMPLTPRGIRAFKLQYGKLNHVDKGLLRKELRYATQELKYQSQSKLPTETAAGV
jgi:hypothetical protein